MMPLSDAQRAYVASLRNVQRELAEIEADKARRDLWEGVDAASMLRDAETARDEANAVRAAREAAQTQEWRIKALRAELDLD